MKLSLVLYTGLSPLLFSQVYNPIPTDSVYWVELESGYDGGNCTYYTYRYIYPVGNITIKNNLYQEYHFNSITTFEISSAPWLPCSPTQYSSNDIYIFIRNDSTNRKVYFYDTNYTHLEKVLYDFNISIGDTIHPESAICACNIQCPYDTFTVAAIDSIDIGGEYRRRFTISRIDTSVGILNLIEGIGANMGFAFNLYCPQESFTSLVCYHYKTIDYSPPEYTGSTYCTTTIGIAENSYAETNFITTLGLNSFYIENDESNSINIACYDMHGKCIMQRLYNESGYFTLDSPPLGVYCLLVLYNGQMLQPFKFINTY